METNARSARKAAPARQQARPPARPTGIRLGARRRAVSGGRPGDGADAVPSPDARPVRLRAVNHPATAGGLHVHSREAMLVWGAVLGPVAWRLLEILVASGLEEASVDDLAVALGAGTGVAHVHAGLGVLAARGLLHADDGGWLILHPLPRPGLAARAELPQWLLAGASARGSDLTLRTPTDSLPG